MNAIKSYYILNLKMLLKNKLPFLWSLIFPVIFIFMNQDNINEFLDLRYYWAYIIFCSYLFGVGIHALNQKESGTLKTFFSIRYTKFEFFFANLFTQITYSFICLTILNVFCTLFFEFSFIKMSLYSTIMIFLGVPIAFATFCLTLLSKININSINSVANILVFTSLAFMSYNEFFYTYNILRYLSDVVMISTTQEIIIYCLLSIICILAGTFSIKKYSVVSTEFR